MMKKNVQACLLLCFMVLLAGAASGAQISSQPQWAMKKIMYAPSVDAFTQNYREAVSGLPAKERFIVMDALYGMDYLLGKSFGMDNPFEGFDEVDPIGTAAILFYKGLQKSEYVHLADALALYASFQVMYPEYYSEYCTTHEAYVREFLRESLGISEEKKEP